MSYDLEREMIGDVEKAEEGLRTAKELLEVARANLKFQLVKRAFDCPNPWLECLTVDMAKARKITGAR